MGIFSGTDISHQSTTNLLNTPPPELVSPSSSTYSSRLSEDRSWGAAGPVSPPMSSYDPSTKSEVPTAKGPEELRTGRNASLSGSAPSQRLPSLSSLFGPNQLRPLNSPQSDHPSPLFSGGVSPLDRPQSASTNPERSFSNSYFPRAPSPPLPPPPHQPRSLYERPSLPQISSHFQGPLSPTARGEFEPAAHHQARNESISSRWSHQSSASDSRREYVLGTGDATPGTVGRRSVSEHRPYQSLGHKRSYDSYEHQQQPTTPSSTPAQHPHARTHHQPHPHLQVASSPSPGGSEAAPVKDGLGPKIWTGTHFLPRFVGQYDVAGEGPCYFYDDGTHCKTVIDGEQVVAHWGVTKAGKPRKRLAIACLTCREKKIKCDPDFPRCVQCEKFGRTCRFKNAPRGGNADSPATSPAEHDESRQLGAPQQPTRAPESSRPSTSSLSVSPRPSLKHGASEGPHLPPHKVARFGYDHQPPQHHHQSHLSHYAVPPPPPPSSMPSRHIQHSQSPMSHGHSHEMPKAPWAQLPRIHEDVLHRAPWQSEPRSRAPL